MTTDSRTYASPGEVALALAALGAADYARLGRIAQFRARGLAEIDWRDLIQEAAQRALEGQRRWPVDIPFLVFMAESIRSIASEVWRRRAMARVETGSNDDIGSLDHVADEAADPERIAVARDLLERLYALFVDDDAARAILQGLADGRAPIEIQAEAGLSPVAYDSTRRRMRRQIARANLESSE